jgi:hypothetical protein
LNGINVCNMQKSGCAEKRHTFDERMFD